MDEKVIPPDEKGWKELKDFFEEDFFDDFLFYRVQAYKNDKNCNEGMATVEVFDCGVILKCHAVNSSERIDKYIYLLLSDGRWVKGLLNTGYELDTNEEIRGGEKFLRITVSLQTKEGICRRIIRKKIEDKK